MNEPKSDSVFNQIQSHLDQLGISYQVKEHRPTKTSEESAAVRGQPLEIGGKALLLKANSEFVLCVLPAHRKLNSGGDQTRDANEETPFRDAR